ncbi:MAG: hypothetical protein M0R74_02580 [Dehalococcoidia bacterium]|nr:hypothetical protein [Dehalococcoidia bacterium]
MRWVISLLATLALLAVTQANSPEAVAQPQIPAVFYGSASIDGTPVPDGTEVRGLIDGKDCTQIGPAYQGTVNDGGVSAYSILVVHESSEPGCGAEGKTVTFTIGGLEAEQTARWEATSPIRLDLNAGAGEPIPLPTPTPTPDASQPTSAAGAATETPTQLQGTPPTDPIDMPRTPVPPGTLPAVQPGDDAADVSGNTSSPVWLVIAGVLLLLAAGGGAAGYLLSRKKRENSPSE